MVNRSWQVRLLGTLAAALLGAASCSWWPGSAVHDRITTTATEVAPAVIVSALPAYRLLIGSDEAWHSSRLVVLSTRIETLESSPLHFRPSDVTLTLPDGTTTRALDRQRARALLDRVDVSPSGLPPATDCRLRVGTAARRDLKRQVGDGLLDEADFTRDQPLQGYLIVDTQAALPSLDGAELEVVVHRLSDAAPVRQVYRFANTAIGVEGSVPLTTSARASADS